MTSTILEQHIHSSDTPHKLTAINATQLRCWSCSQTIDLGSALGTRPSTARSTSTSSSTQPLNLKDTSACPEHPGMRKNACGPCRSELLAPASLIDPVAEEATA